MANTVPTPVGTNVTVNFPQSIGVTFPAVLQSGTSVTIATEPGATSGVPGGFLVNGSALTTILAYTIETTTIYVGPVTTCFTVKSVSDAMAFGGLAVLHSETSGFVDRTVSRDFANKTICAKTDTLSPFAIAIKSVAHPLSCDLNDDGIVDVVDVGLAVAQALGLSACATADFDMDGRCTIIDVQRVVNAALGQACVIGP